MLKICSRTSAQAAICLAPPSEGEGTMSIGPELVIWAGMRWNLLLGTVGWVGICCWGFSPASIAGDCCCHPLLGTLAAILISLPRIHCERGEFVGKWLGREHLLAFGKQVMLALPEAFETCKFFRKPRCVDVL